MHTIVQRLDAAMRPNVNEGPTILALTLSVTTVALISTIARFYVRIKMIKNVGWDVSGSSMALWTLTDIFARTMLWFHQWSWYDRQSLTSQTTLTIVQCIVGQCIIVPQVLHGAGRHVEYIDPANFQTGMKLNFISQPIYLFAICFLKLSIGFFLLRIAVKPFYKRLIIGIMGGFAQSQYNYHHC
jgi:hypothetical protein